MDAPLPPMTEDLTRRLAGAGSAFTTEWLKGAARLPGNPRGLRIERFGAAVAPAATAAPELDFMNRVMNLYPEDAGRVGDILAFYRDLGIRPWFELAPAGGFEALADALSTGGAAQIGFHTTLYGRATGAVDDASTGEPPGVEVRAVDATEVDVFSTTLLRGFELSEDAMPDAVADHAHWADLEGWRLYLATVDGEPAAAAALTVRDGIGLLASAATVPAFRGRGCQTALIRRRVADASAAGCELITATATFGSPSHRNVGRAGLQVAFTAATWRVRETNEGGRPSA